MATPGQTLRLFTTRHALRRIQSSSLDVSSKSITHFSRHQSLPRRNASLSLDTTSLRGLHITVQRHKTKTAGPLNEPVPDQPPPTDFSQMDVLAQTPVPSTSVDICYYDGFKLNSGVRISDGDGALLVGGEAFAWRPWRTTRDGKEGRWLLNERGQFEISEEGFGILGLLWPRPDLLILGLGPDIRPLSPETRKLISSLGIRVEILDTRNAASQFNLLATERGVDDVAAALIPIGWKEGVGAV